MPRELEESLSSRALAALLGDCGYAKITAETGIHRTQLWRYSTGRGKPDAEQIAKLHRVSDGKVAANGWETLPTDGEPASSPRSNGNDTHRPTGSDR